jgi:hypothetical protein
MVGDVIHSVTKTAMLVLAKEKMDIVIKVLQFFLLSPAFSKKKGGI